MADKHLPVPAQILKDIEVGSQRVSRLATELSQRINAFENWLNQLPGKVDTTLWTSAPNDPSSAEQFGLSLGRSGKRWSLSFTYAHCQQLEMEWEIEWKPLAEASLDTKLYAVQQFPRFLAQITKAQDKLAKQLETAHDEFDAFARAIGLTLTKEGK